MTMKSFALFAATLFAFVVITNADHSTRNVQASPAQASSSALGQAKQVLTKAIKAIGGESNLMAMTGISITATGQGKFMFEAGSPEDVVVVATYERVYYQTLDKLRIDETTNPLPINETVTVPVPATNTINIIDGMVGIQNGTRLEQKEGEQPSHAVGAYKQQQYLFNPHWMLKEAKKNSSKLGRSYKEGSYDVLVIKDNVTPDFHIYVNSKTGVIDRLAVMESNPLVMDIRITVKFSGWAMASTGGLKFPMMVQEFESLYNADLVTERRTQVSVQKIDDSVFAGIPNPSKLLDPEGFKFGRKTQHNTANFFWIGFHYPYDPLRYSGNLFPVVNAMVWWWPSLAGIIAIRDPVDNGLIVLEAPGSSKHMQTFWKLINQDLAFDWHIKYLVCTHHHIDHSAGVRELIALSKLAKDKGPTKKKDAKLVVGYNVSSFWHRVFEAPSTVIPDSLTKLKGYKPEIIAIPTVNGNTTVLNDPGVRIISHHVSGDPHAKDELMTVIEIWGNVFVYEADLYNTAPAPLILKDGPVALFNALKDKKYIDSKCKSSRPMFILGSHGAPETLTTSITRLCGAGFIIGCDCP